MKQVSDDEMTEPVEVTVKKTKRRRRRSSTNKKNDAVASAGSEDTAD